MEGKKERIPDGVQIVVDVYSGRPNPVLNCSESDMEEIRERLKDLKPAKPNEPVRLGYRGFLILNTGQIKGIPAQMRVYDGVLAILTEKGKFQHHADTNQLEKWLIHQTLELSKKHKLGLEQILPKK
ncbi:MAG: hypothetical protein ACFFBR_09965 [Promethearchaeota archaeon]